MIQSPVNYCTVPAQNQQVYCATPMVMPQQQQQPSYNAVKIDIHNPKVTDGPQACSPYAMPTGSCYMPQMAPNMPICYPAMPQVCPNGVIYTPQIMPPMPQPMPMTQPMPMPMPMPVNMPIQQPVTPQPVTQVTNAPQQPVQQPVPQPVPVVPQPVPQVPVQQVINNGVPSQQTIIQSPAQQTPVNQPTVQQPVVNTTEAPSVVTPNTTMPTVDITPVLKGLQSNNLAEQSAALGKIGEAAENPQEVKKYLETSVLDSLLGILNSDISNLEPATKEQIDARTKMVNEKPMTDAEKELAMTLAPREMAEQNKQHALYSIAILQKSLASEIEAKTGEKLSLEKLPAIDQVVNTIKTNPSPLLRSSGIVALAHLIKPEYNPILSEIFTLAKNDQDPNVQQVAAEALNKIQKNEAK